ncbi:unnamed protein product [Auanema sp. JU1783]|nr:unnamed protein product [Auanema sp. JU1783]
MSTVVSQVSVNNEKPIDREKICPLLLRVFCANGRHNSLQDYGRGGTPANELQMYTWMDCTLRELTSLIKEVNPEARRRGTNFDFAIVTPDKNYPRFYMRTIGITTNGQRGIDDGKTLQMCKFEVGDFIDVAISMPGAGMGQRRNFNYDRDRRQGSPNRDRR